MLVGNCGKGGFNPVHLLVMPLDATEANKLPSRLGFGGNKITVLHEGDKHTQNNSSYEFPLRGRNIFLAVGFRMSTRDGGHANSNSS